MKNVFIQLSQTRALLGYSELEILHKNSHPNFLRGFLQWIALPTDQSTGQAQTSGAISAYPHNRQRYGTTPRWTPDQLQMVEMHRSYVRCCMFDHWYADHNEDGTLRGGTASFEKSQSPVRQDDIREQQPPNEHRGSVSFNMVFTGPREEHHPTARVIENIGTIVDTGASYSTMGHSDGCEVSHIILRSCTGG